MHRDCFTFMSTVFYLFWKGFVSNRPHFNLTVSRCIKLFRWIIWTVVDITVNSGNIVSTRHFIYSAFCWQTHRAHPATDLLVCAGKYQSVQLHRTTSGTEGCPFRFSVSLSKKTRWFAAQKPEGFSRWKEVSSPSDIGDIGKKFSIASNVRIK